MLDTLAMAKQLSGEYRRAFEMADMYSTGNGGSEKVKSERMMDLYDMLMEAEAEGKPIEKIIGYDIERFCKDFFAEEKNKFGEILVRTYNVARILFVFSIIDYFLAEEGDFFTTQVNVFPIVSGLLIGCILTLFYKFVLQPIVFKNKKMNPTIHSLIILAVFVIAIIISCVLGEDIEVYLNNLMVLIASGGYILVYLIGRSVWRIRTYGKAFGIHKEEKQLEKEFNAELDKKETLQINADVMAKEFKKKNAKNRKKGKPELTQAEYAAMVRKRESHSKMWNFIIVALVVFVPTVWEMVSNNVMEGLIYGAILVGVEFLIWRFLYKIVQDASDAKLYILDECEKKGITIEEFVRRFYDR